MTLERRCMDVKCYKERGRIVILTSFVGCDRKKENIVVGIFSETITINAFFIRTHFLRILNSYKIFTKKLRMS